MPRSIPHYVPSLNKELNKTKYKAHLSIILNKYKVGESVNDENDILDLKYFIKNYSDKREDLKSDFNIENCCFCVQISDEGTKCFYIVDCFDDEINEQFSIHNFGNPPTAFDNFKRLFLYLVREIKYEKRIEMCMQKNLNVNDYDLWHINPKSQEIVREFLRLKKLEDKIDEIISPNGEGNEIPHLTVVDPKSFTQEIINFYSDKIKNDQSCVLRKITY